MKLTITATLAMLLAAVVVPPAQADVGVGPGVRCQGRGTTSPLSGTPQSPTAA